MNTRYKIHHSQSILFISALDFWSMGNGKGGPALWRTLIGYAKRGWKVYFITGNYGQRKRLNIPYNINVVRFDILWLKRLMKIKKIGFFAKIIWWSCFQIIAFIKALQIYRQNNIDVVYGYEIYGVPVAKLLSKAWKIPLISRFQGSILRLVWMKKIFWQLRAWEYIVAYKIPSDLIIMTNDGSQGNRLLLQMGVDESKVKFWLNGIDKKSFAFLPKTNKARQDLKIYNQFVLLCVSRLIKLKGVDVSIKVMAELVKDISDLTLCIVGDGDERKKLEQLVNELGLEQYVRFEGAVPHNNIPKYLAAADIFLSFYDWSNVGNPLLEAMMAGKCIVTLNNGDTGRFIQNGYNGVLLDYSDLPKLPQVIKELLEDEERRNYLGTNARKFAEKHFWSWEERIEAEIKEVTSLVERIES